MTKKQLYIGLIAAVLGQLFILVTEYTNAVYPLWTGREIKLATVPVDPRSMFRGNYARLNYQISEIPGADINTARVPRHGEIVFIRLAADKNGLYSYNGASLKKPQDGLFIRGRIQTYSSVKRDKYRVKYGIEAFFAPKKKALQLEKRLRDNALARIMIAGNGKAALLDVIADKSSAK
ncbi:MAG: hypothetical protein CSB24_06000 [Deltaproteobacteria bacterium]|nr:MAG: hypothetical protein CSB24_06000 [Deltaproteobacteria bacterium]